MGNSEVGHMNLGAGRTVYQDFTRITKDIADGTFAENPVLTAAVDKAVKDGKAIHLMGLLSPGGVHSHEDHFIAMIELAAQRGAQQIYVHGFLDGRDMPPRSTATATIWSIGDRFRKPFRNRLHSARWQRLNRDDSHGASARWRSPSTQVTCCC